MERPCTPLGVKQIALSGSDGTRLTVEQINQAADLLKYSLQRLKEINDGTYMPMQPPIVFDGESSKELWSAVYYAFSEANKLTTYILYHE